MSGRGKMVVSALLVVSVAGAAGAGAAQADFGAPVLLSYSPREQADAVGTSALSADGHWLAYSGSLDGIKGVFRRNLDTGATDVVAGGDAYNFAPVTDAQLPSISADGRYVSFTTSAPLDPVDDTNTAPDVYVRDMDAPGNAYTLASALDGSATGLTYNTTNNSGGSMAAPRAALSADGRRVAFVTQDASNLAGPATPAGQVAVRDLDTQRTTLVSTTRDPATGAMTGLPVPDGAVVPTAVDVGGLTSGTTKAMVAALSADGTTVAWLGQHIDRQAPTLSDEPTEPSDNNTYDEPLWRRVADGPSAPTRRIVGGGDPLAPGCSSTGTLTDPACQGPYPDLGANDNQSQGLDGGWVTKPSLLDATPSLSADGRTVVLLGTPPIPPQAQPTTIADLFWVDMTDGLARRDAVHRLTQELTTSQSGFGIFDAAIAPNGRRIAFSTGRTDFTLTPPFLTGSVPSQTQLAELYLVDLDGQSLRRLSTTTNGGPSSLDGSDNGANQGQGAASPSFDTTGKLLAFDSPAQDLVAGDTNDANDAFLVTDTSPPAGVPGRTEISPPPPGPVIPRAWTWALRAVAQKDGTVRFDADLPGAGTVKVTARATVPVVKHVRIRKKHGGHRTITRTVLEQRQVALKSTRPRGGGVTSLSLKVTKAYTKLVRATGGLYATARVAFTAPGHRALNDSLAIRFRITPPKSTKKSKTIKKSKTTKKKAAR
jgi:Tol biopolymer transport system component